MADPYFRNLLQSADSLLTEEDQPDYDFGSLLSAADELLAPSMEEPTLEEWGIVGEPKVNLGRAPVAPLPPGVTPLEAETIATARRAYQPPAPTPSEIGAPLEEETWTSRAADLYGGVQAIQEPSANLARGVVSGLASTAVTAPGRALEWASTYDPALGLLRAPGEALTAAGHFVTEAMAPKQAVAEDVMNDPRVLLDPNWWAFNAGATGGSIAAFFIPYVGAAGGVGRIGQIANWTERTRRIVSQVGGVTAGTAVESLVEGALAYDDAINAGQSPQQAAEAAAEVAGRNAALIGATAATGYALPKIINAPAAARLFAGAATEAGQEVGQQIASNLAAQRYDPTRDPYAGAATAGIFGALGGGAISGLTGPTEAALSERTGWGITPEAVRSLEDWVRAAQGQPLRGLETFPVPEWVPRGTFGAYADADAAIRTAAAAEAPVAPPGEAMPPGPWYPAAPGSTFFTRTPPGAPPITAPAPELTVEEEIVTGGLPPSGEPPAPVPPPVTPPVTPPAAPPPPVTPKPGRRRLEDISDEELIADIMGELEAREAAKPKPPVRPTPEPEPEAPAPEPEEGFGAKGSRYEGERLADLIPTVREEQLGRRIALKHLEDAISDPKNKEKTEQLKAWKQEFSSILAVYDSTWTELFDAGVHVAPIRDAVESRAAEVTEAPTVDILPTGEEQPRLPGKVGEVREQEIPTPKEELPEPEFKLGAPPVGPEKRKQGTIEEAIETTEKREIIEREKKAAPPVTPKEVAPTEGEPAIGSTVRVRGGRTGVVKEVVTAGKAGGTGIHRLRRRALLSMVDKTGKRYEQFHDLDQLTPVAEEPAAPAPAEKPGPPVAPKEEAPKRPERKRPAEPERIEVDPARLAHGTWNAKTGRREAEGDISAAYSGDTIANKGTLRGIVKIGDRIFANVGGSAGGGWDLVSLVPRDEYRGTPITYAEKEGYGYVGILVKHRGKQYVMTEPRVTVVAGKAAAPVEEKPVEKPKPPVAPKEKPPVAPKEAKTGQPFTATLYQGRGASLEQIYGKEAVEQGRAVPLLGWGQYYAFTEEDASEFGTVTKHEVTLQNPLVIDTDAKWNDVVEKAGAGAFWDMGRLIATGQGAEIAEASRKIGAWARAQGYDGIIARVTWENDDTKKFRRLAAHSQVVVFTREAAAKPAPPVKEPVTAPVPSAALQKWHEEAKKVFGQARYAELRREVEAQRLTKEEYEVNFWTAEIAKATGETKLKTWERIEGRPWGTVPREKFKPPVTPKPEGKKAEKQQQIEREREKLSEQEQELLKKMRQHLNKLTTGVDPEGLKLMVQWLRVQIRKGVLKFREAVLKFQTDFGDDAERYAPALSAAWDVLQSVEDLDVPGDAAAIMAEAREATRGKEGAPGTEGAGERGGRSTPDEQRRPDDTGYRGADRLVIARASHTKHVSEEAVPEDLSKKLYPHQTQGVAKALASMTRDPATNRESNGFLLADGTGAGKTSQELAVAEIFRRQGKPVLIVTKSEVIKPNWAKKKIGGSFKADARRLGINLTLAAGTETLTPGTIHITSYDRIGRFTPVDGAILIFDESHALKNAGSGRTNEAMKHIRQADAVFYASATPADKAQHIDYLARVGILEGKTRDEQYRALGLIPSERRTKYGPVKVWVVSSQVGSVRVYERMAELFARMTAAGQMLKREISMADVEFEIEHERMPAEAHTVMKTIEMALSRGQGYHGVDGLMRARIRQAQRWQQEPFKIDRVAKMVHKERYEGRQVVVFVSRVNYSEVGVNVKNTLTGESERIVVHSSEGTVKTLKERLIFDGHEPESIVELHGEAEEGAIEAMEKFQTGRAQIMLATIESGGTGINLDDTTGDSPRTMIIVTAPFSAVDNVQAVGRVWRLTTKSPPKIRYLFTDTDVDQWNAGIIAAKMKALGATVKGEVGRLNIDPRILEFDPSVEDVEELDKELKRRERERPPPPPPPPPTRDERVLEQQGVIDVALRELQQAQDSGAKRAAEVRRERIRMALNEPVRLKPREFNEAFARALVQWTQQAPTARLEARLDEIDNELAQERPWEVIEQALVNQELAGRRARALLEETKREADEREARVQKEWDHFLRPVTKDLDEVERREVERIADELETFPFVPRARIEEKMAERGKDIEWVAGAAGAPVYDDILSAPDAVNHQKEGKGIGKPARDKVASDIRALLAGKSPTRLAARAVIVARARDAGGYPSGTTTVWGGSLSKPLLPPWWEEGERAGAPGEEELPDWVTEGEAEESEEPGAQGMAVPVTTKPQAAVIKPKPKPPVRGRKPQRPALELPPPPPTATGLPPRSLKQRLAQFLLGRKAKAQIKPLGIKVDLHANEQWGISEIREHLSKLLGVPIREGGAHWVQAFGKKRVLGLFYPKARLIRLEHLNELPVFGHEVGHALDKRLKIDLKDPRWKDELLRLGQAASMKSYKIDQQLAEGVAEFFREYLQRPSNAAQQAPQFVREFERKVHEDPELWAGIDLAKRQTVGLINLNYAARGKLRIDYKGQREESQTLLQQLEEKWIDDRAVIRRATDSMGEVTADEHAYWLSRIAAGAESRADKFLINGPVDRAGRFLGPGLASALRSVRRDLDNFASYLVAKRVIELQRRPVRRIVNTGMTLTEAHAIVNQYQQTQTFEDASKQVYAYMDALLQYALENRLISGGQTKAMRDAAKVYVPLERIQDGFEAQGFQTGRRYANRVQPYKRIVGSTRDIINPLETIIKNTYRLVDVVENNRVMLALVNQMRDARNEGTGKWLSEVAHPMQAVNVNLDQLKNDIRNKMAKDGVVIDDAEWANIDWNQMVTVFMPSHFIRGDKGYISVIDRGRRRVYQVNDIPLYKALTEGNVRPEHAGLMRLLVAAARTLRAGATLTPGFIAKNPYRDQFTAYVQSRYGYKPFYDAGIGIAHALGKSEEWKQFLASGVGQASVIGSDRDRLRQSLKNLSRGPILRTPLEYLRMTSELMENVTRFGEFRRAMKAELANGATPEEAYVIATMAARDVTIDFSRAGTSGRKWNEITAFLNSRIQGYARAVETFTGKDVDPSQRARKATAAVVRSTFSITSLSIALWLLNKDDPDYDKLEEWEKNAFWHLKLPWVNGWVKIPKPFELGTTFGTVPEMVLDYFYKKDPELVNRILGAYLPTRMRTEDRLVYLFEAAAAFGPTAVVPVMEIVTNYDTFRDHNIVSPWRRYPDYPQLEYNQWTSETAKQLGRLMHMSPAFIDHAINGYFAGLGAEAVKASDALLRRLGLTPRNVVAQPAGRRFPGIGSALGSVFRSAEPRSNDPRIQAVYDLAARDEGLRKAANILAASKQREEAREATGKRASVEQVKRARHAIEEFGRIGKKLTAVYENPDLSPDEKRERVNKLVEQMIREAKKVRTKEITHRPPVYQPAAGQ